MGFLDDIKNKTANVFLNSDMVLCLVNKVTGRYATIKGISLNGKAIECTAIPNGSQESVTITASGFTFADDNSSITIGTLAADRPWAENALKDFAQGRQFPIPEAGRDMVGKIRAFL